MYELPETMEVITSLATLMASSAAMIGAYAALSGLNTWKKQRIWERDRELAFDILLLLKKRHNSFRALRSGWLSASELGEYDPNDDDSTLRARSGAFQNRWDTLLDYRAQMDTAIIEADVLWNYDLEAKSLHLDVIENKIIHSIMDLLELEQLSKNTGVEPSTKEEQLRLRKIIFERHNEEDVAAKAYLVTMNQMELVLKPKIGQNT